MTNVVLPVDETGMMMAALKAALKASASENLLVAMSDISMVQTLVEQLDALVYLTAEKKDMMLAVELVGSWVSCWDLRLAMQMAARLDILRVSSMESKKVWTWAVMKVGMMVDSTECKTVATKESHMVAQTVGMWAGLMGAP